MVQLDTDADDVARQLAAQLHAAASGLGELDPVHAEAGRVVLATASPPRRSGATAAGQAVRATPGGVQLTSTTRYWTFVHWGAPRAGTRAQPWLAEALTRSNDDVLAVYAAHVQAQLSTLTT